MATIKEESTKLFQLREEQRGRFDALKTAEDAGKKDAIREEINKAEPDMAKLHDSVVKAQSLVESERENNEALEKLKESKSGIPFNLQDAAGAPAGDQLDNVATKSIGDMLVNSPAFKEFAERGHVHKSMGQDMGEFKSLVEAFHESNGSEKAAGDPFTSTGFTGYFRPPGVTLTGVAVPHIAQLLPQGSIQGHSIRYVREVSFTPGATAVAEGDAKPGADWDLEEKDAPVRKIAVWTKLSDEALADFGYVRDYINQRLPLMVQIEEDNQLLNGTGSNGQITGILNTTGVLEHGIGLETDETTAITGDTTPDAILRGLTRVVAESHFEPTGLVMNPFDWMDVRLLRSGTGDDAGGTTRGQYLYGDPSSVGANTLWGMPIVTTTRIDRGTALGGAFNLGAQILRAQGITMQMTNTDQDDFIKNLVTFRVEERLAFPVYRPQAFVVIDLDETGGD